MEILAALDKAAAAMTAAGTELAQLTAKHGEAWIGPDGDIHEGTKLRYEVAISEAVTDIHESYVTDPTKGRPPAEDIRKAMAMKRVRTGDPQLWADYNATETRIEALKLFISIEKAVISAYQSLRRAEG